ncbi:hypothetical protein [Streptomyces californicus]|uniref:hypothetical protein n=1 Tax=Streptomyces californicus TaxID=67351 RepID=UPI00296F60A8|nr:hypothetical protein [Streptomyces californicus]MDW4916422.1 hypothetical protein [Streptomyces californicus]
MYKIQFRNPQGRLVTAQNRDAETIQKLADQARQDMPETHELRVREVVQDQASGDFIWADCTAAFTR